MTAPSVPVGVPAPGRRAPVRHRRIGEKWYTPYLFIAPHFLLFAVFIGFPFLFGLYISLHRWDFFQVSPFVGIQNYLDLFDPTSIHFERFWQTLVNTVIFVVISTPLLVGFALLLAALLNQRFPGRQLFRTIYFAPFVLSVAVVALVWWWIFDAQAGIVNQVLAGLGITGPAWLAENPFAWITIVVATVWWTIGYNTIIFLAGLQSISADLYEAASIDGASPWQQFLHITIPGLRPIILLVVTIQLLASFNLLGQPQIMTGGGPPIGETTPVLLYFYDTAFRPPYELGVGAAMAYLVAIVIAIVSIVNFRVLRSED